MKDILIVGGAGNVGHKLIDYLIEDYSITILDLKSKLSMERMAPYENRIKIVYGDVNDYHLIKDLVKKNDVVINLAGIMPPLANLSEKLANDTNYEGTKNIVDAILEVNPECIYLYTSFISIYGETENIERDIKLNGETNNPEDIYSVSLIRSENYIKENLTKYIVLRLPIVTTPNNYYIKHMSLNRMTDFITVDDLNNIITKVIVEPKAYGKFYNVKSFTINSNTFIKHYYKSFGKINMFRRNKYYGRYIDADKIDKLIDISYQSYPEYFKSLKKQTNIFKRLINKLLNICNLIYFKIKAKK